MPELNIQSKLVGKDACILTLEGFLDAHTFERLDEQITSLFDQGVYKVIANLKGVEYISSAGAGVFIGSLATAQESGGDIVLVDPTPNVQEVFDLLGLSQIFRILDTNDAAVKALQAPPA
jgi:anti-sigma B factor antagonist